MRRILTPAAAGIALLFAACQGDTPAADTAADTTAAIAEATVNTLTPEEQQQGWQLLFDGQSFEGWRGFSQDSIPSAWVIQDGALYRTEDSTSQGGDIMTVQQFDDFELALEYKIAECGNSGIMYNVAAQGDAPYETGPEYQVLDACHPDASAGSGRNRRAGANYDMHDAAVDAGKPAGEWNQVRIVVQGDSVQHFLNGQKTVEYVLNSDDWKQRVAGSKWKDVTTYGTAEQGHIDLQDHGDPVWYRNIKIRPLS